MNDALGHPQSVLILGGSSDIGRALLRVLIPRRTRTVILAGRGVGSGGELDQAAQEARQLGAHAVTTVEWDATDVERHALILGEILGRHDIDLVLMAVGRLGHQETVEMHPSQAHDLIDVNFAGPAVSCLIVANALRAQGHGILVVLSSVAGEVVRRDNFVYGSAKAGLDGFALGLGDSLRHSGARVMVVRPGFVHTRMTAGLAPAPMSITADELARHILAGLSRRRVVVWAPPRLRGVMSVLRHLPRRLLALIPHQ
ncbi:MAG: SDR family NAD(P)-dependent oxidoreductase [Acidimicrobiales bacterium]